MISDILYKISIGELISEDEQREMKTWFDNLQNAPEQLSSMFKGLSTISTLSQITSALGTVNRGNFLSGDDGDYLDTTGNNPFTGVGMISPGLTVGTDQAAIFGMNTGVLQFWLSALTGKIFGGKGAVVIDEDGIAIPEGGDAILFQNSNEGYTIFSMQGPGARINNYSVESATNLISNGDFETGDFTSWTETDATSKLSVVVDSSDPNNYVFKIAAGATSSNYITQNLSTAKGKFKISFRAKTDNANVNIGFEAALTKDVRIYGNKDWRNITIFFNTLGFGDASSVKIYATPGASTNLYIDDLSVVALDGYSEVALGSGAFNYMGLVSDVVAFGQVPYGQKVWVRDGVATNPGGLHFYADFKTLSGGSSEYSLPAHVSVVRFNPSSDTTITSIDYDYEVGTKWNYTNNYRYLPLFNVGTATVTLKHEDTGATAANRFSFPNSIDVYIKPGHSVTIWYDGTSSRWRLAGTSVTSASQIGITDSGGYFTGTDTEAALQELGGEKQYTAIEGLKLIYNSAASVSVDKGSCYAENGDWINVTSTLTASSLSLTINTMYHLYLYLSSGSPALEVVTTAPVAWKGTAKSKTGDTSRRYAGSIWAIASNTMSPFIHNPISNFIIYDVNLSSYFRVLSAGAATTDTDVSCSAGVPSTSRIAKLRFTNLGTIGASIGNSVGGYILDLSNATSGYNHIFADWLLDTSQQFRYKALGAGGSLYVDIQGYYYDR